MKTYFNTLTLKGKGLVLTSVITLSLLITVALGALALIHLENHLKRMAGDSLPRLEAVSSVERSIQQAHFDFTRSISWATAGISGDTLDKQVSQATSTRSVLQSLLDQHNDGKDVAVVSEASEELTAYIRASTDATDMLAMDPSIASMVANEADVLYDALIIAVKNTATLERMRVEEESQVALASADRELIRFAGLSALGLILCVALSSIITRSIARPMVRMTDNMKALSENDLSVEIEGSELKNEIGAMAKALAVFRDTAIESKRLREAEETARAQREAAEKEALEAKAAETAAQAERDRQEKQAAEARAEESRRLEDSLAEVIRHANAGNFKARIDASFAERSMEEMKLGVNELLSGIEASLAVACDALKELAEGHLQSRMEGKFEGVFAELQDSTNSMASSFQTAIAEITLNADNVKTDSQEISSAANDLSARTERTAANLEETSAAMEQVAASVSSAADRAERVDGLVEKTLSNAKSGEEVVQEAVKAMEEISEFSDQIGKMVNVINDISFQTNLLALNAGVEAARAGESGRGFSVVASEVRALALRASESAKEIEGLIAQSTSQVARGVELVNRSGEALNVISQNINEVSQDVASIAESAREQSNGITEVNTAVSEIDSATQQNAAMFEQTTAASQSLVSSAKSLTDLASRFDTGQALPTATQAPTPATKPDEPVSPPPAVTREPAPVAKAVGAPDYSSSHQEDDDGWADF